MMQAYRHLYHKQGYTLLKNIFRLRAGSNLYFSNGKIKISQFQKFELDKWLKYFKTSPSAESVIENFEKIFIKEIKLRLPNDVPYFAGLSGGIDSSTLAYFISKTKKNNIQSIFGISSSDQEKKITKFISEVENSNNLAKRFNFNHSHVYLNEKNAIKAWWLNEAISKKPLEIPVL